MHREAHVRGPGFIWIVVDTRRWTELEEIIHKSEFWCVAVEVGALAFPLIYPRKSILFSPSHYFHHSFANIMLTPGITQMR